MSKPNKNEGVAPQAGSKPGSPVAGERVLPEAGRRVLPEAGQRPQPRLAKGFRDIEAAELRASAQMIETIRSVYERYGFEPLETPAIEYTDVLGKFLPDQDRPNEGVFSFQDVAPEAREQASSEQWMSLRYDLTAPLARYVAQNFTTLPKPFRRYAFGSVYRNEKPGPGRFRQFTSSTPIPSAPTASPRMPRCACSRPIRWKRWG